MDPFNIPGVDSAFNPQADLTRVVAQTAPLAPVWHGVQQNAPGQPSASAVKSSSQGVLPAFWGKVEAVGSQAGHILGEGAAMIGHALGDMATAPVKFVESGVNAFKDTLTSDSLSKQSQAMSDRFDSLINSYKSGQISKTDYLKGLQEFSVDNQNLSNQLDKFNSQVSEDKQSGVKAAINTAGDAVTVISLGTLAPEVATGEASAAELLTSASTLSQGAATITRLASDEAAWKVVSPVAQQAIRVATSQVLDAAGQQATAAQVSKTVAANLLLKYPLTYNAISGTGQQVYDELNNNKYGDAVKTVAFNAALLLAGGPIGWGLKKASKALKATSIAAGLRPGSILDELSSRIGNGDSRALAQIAQKQVNSGNAADVKAMIVGLESNLKAAGGNPAKAINLITDHLENYVGWGSMKNMDHQQAWDNIVNYWKHAEGLQQLKSEGQIAGMTPGDSRVVVPGRFTTGDKNAIALAVSKDGEAGWMQFKNDNPNSAAANNPNVDKQITNIAKTITNPEERRVAINNISTQSGLSGIPKDYTKVMAKDGYIAIVPRSHNLPIVQFPETSGKLATSGAEGDFFVHAGTPVPVLQSVGNFLTWAGLSPEVASQRVNDVFQKTFQDGAAKLGFLSMAGDTAEQTSQNVLSKLSNYMKAPTGGLSIAGHPLPITDMRQLTTGDVMRALDISKSEAKSVQEAIMQSYIDVPRHITGLGNKILDYNFKYNPTASVYSRVQGAFRFGWNPIFKQGKLPLKAEFLSQMQTGGKFPTVAGTNRFMNMFFPGQYKELNSIVDNPKFMNLLPGGLGGEAADSTGVTVAGTGHYPKTALLPVAGVIKDMAGKVGMDSASFIDKFPSQVQDSATAILHYDRNSSFLNSPLARTLNFAFFPFRFNVKVATFMAKSLAQQEPLVQYAAIKGIMSAQGYLKSPQGQAWYSQNADAIGLFKYFSPVETISTISSALGLKHDSVAQYGELGGLPFGWIPQMLDSVGLTHFGQAYVNPKTGAISKDYVPTSMYGAANAAINDLLGSLFTYPGATAGLPSKGSIDRKVVGGLLPGSSKDFNAVTPPNITPEDQQFSQIVKQQNGGSVPSQSGTNQPQSTPGERVPTTRSTLTTPIKKSSGGSSRKKKADFRPSLLPGQSELGQI